MVNHYLLALIVLQDDLKWISVNELHPTYKYVHTYNDGGGDRRRLGNQPDTSIVYVSLTSYNGWLRS